MNEKLKETIVNITGLNIDYYHKGMTERCLRRRMEINNVDPEEYVDLLKNDVEEVHKLLEEFTVGITTFFRDKTFFSTLKKYIGEELPERDSIEIWSAGCSTGEEAYSLAIVLDELGRDGNVLATDISEEALKQGSEGIYEEGDIKKLSKSRREDYFRKTDSQFKIISKLREVVTFEKHDIISDTPPASFDIIICRNVFKFFVKNLQKTVFINFHKPLRNGGLLGLGRVETVPSSLLGEFFTTLDRKERIYKKI